MRDGCNSEIQRTKSFANLGPMIDNTQPIIARQSHVRLSSRPKPVLLRYLVRREGAESNWYWPPEAATPRCHRSSRGGVRPQDFSQNPQSIRLPPPIQAYQLSHDQSSKMLIQLSRASVRTIHLFPRHENGISFPQGEDTSWDR